VTVPRIEPFGTVWCPYVYILLYWSIPKYYKEKPSNNFHMLFHILGSLYPSMRRFTVPAAPVVKTFDAVHGCHHFDVYLSLLGVVN
jgi:hypothetical protein